MLLWISQISLELSWDWTNGENPVSHHIIHCIVPVKHIYKNLQRLSHSSHYTKVTWVAGLMVETSFSLLPLVPSRLCQSAQRTCYYQHSCMQNGWRGKYNSLRKMWRGSTAKASFGISTVTNRQTLSLWQCFRNHNLMRGFLIYN
jgi:hypothetical protein